MAQKRCIAVSSPDVAKEADDHYWRQALKQRASVCGHVSSAGYDIKVIDSDAMRRAVSQVKWPTPNPSGSTVVDLIHGPAADLPWTRSDAGLGFTASKSDLIDGDHEDGTLSGSSKGKEPICSSKGKAPVCNIREGTLQSRSSKGKEPICDNMERIQASEDDDMSSSVHGVGQNQNEAGGGGGDNGRKKAGAEEKVEKVPFMKLFSFADRWDYVLMAVGSVGACAHGASVPVFFIFFGKLINIIGIASFFPAMVSGRVAKYSLDFVYLGVVILFSSWTEVACWMHTGERQAAKMRLAYLRSMLDQDIAVFDTEASTGEVINAITSDVLVVQDAISEKIAEEVIGNVRTVQAFVGEEKAVRTYREALLRTYKYGKRGGLAKGLGLGSMHSVLFLSWALLVWFTGIVVHKRISNGGESFTTMLNVVIAGLDLDVKWLRGQIGLVNQEPALFATSIRENILYGKSDATADEIDHAAKLSEAITFINNLPERYETQVGERGIQLSGGQKQRIAISRAILKNPSILLLDEATSALDAESEKSVQEALDRVMVGRTTVVIAHRLSTIRNADTIAVVDGGRIVETGTHEQLMANPLSAYSSLIQLQEAAQLQRKPSFSHSTSITRPLRHVSVHGIDIVSCRRRYGAGEANDEGQGKGKPVSMKKLYSMVRPDWVFGVSGTLSAFVAGAQMPLFALGVTQALVSYYMGWETTKREVRKIATLFCGGAVLTVVFHVIEHLSFGIMGERLTLRVREKMFAAILRNEIGCPVRASRLETDATLVRTIVVDRSTILLQNVGMIVTSLIIAFILNWRITLVVLATYPLMVSGHISEANMLAAEAVSNMRTVAAFCAEEKVIKLYADELKEPGKRSFRRGQGAGVFYGVSQFFLFSSYALALWYGSHLMSKELATFRSVMKSFMVLIVTALAMGETLAMAPDIIKGNQMASSVFEILDRKTEVQIDTGDDIKKVEGVIQLRDVEFRYPSRSEVAVFKGLDLLMKAGKSMALVGMSGSGKSTVLSLILRFYDPIAGKVLVDGKDIKKLKLKSLRRHIGLVQQEPALFATTIYENILYGKDGATEAEVIEAAKLANAHTFISSLPEGYQTKVGERGVQLSGGQKQRIAIARALVKDPAILLLDEATSALDVESERVVQQALDRVMKNRTTVMVAHRLSTIKNANVISVIQDGKIIEQGDHQHLIENKNGAYHKLVNLQQQQQQQLQGGQSS
ncbi:ABC transporter B family member 2 [Triticum urartu]|uniref:ABC transporter B family member 2 n=1 Tax=Triticum urartu TaxID=4572 RepID=M7ZU34_TRIUA|nr:ABC transporter B family member 2 [Triticum urartu]